jgi:hypothetical protein
MTQQSPPAKKSRFKYLFLISLALAFSACCSILLISTHAQDEPPGRRLSKEEALARRFKKHESLKLDLREVARQARQGGKITLKTANSSLDLSLTPYDLRAPGYKLVETIEGGIHREIKPGPVKTYKAKVKGMDGAIARFFIDDDSFRGLILKGKEEYHIEPMQKFAPEADAGEFVLYRSEDLLADSEEEEGGSCGLRDEIDLSTTAGQLISKAPTADGVSTAGALFPRRDLWVAGVGDFQFRAKYTSTLKAEDAIFGNLGVVDAIYERDLGINIKIPYVNIWTYDDFSTFNSTNPEILLDKFANYINSHSNDSGLAYRDVAHLWTGKDLDGTPVGIARTGTVCSNRPQAVSLSQHRLDYKYNKDTIVVAHELGHNLGAGHINPGYNTIMHPVIYGDLNRANFYSVSVDQIASYVNTYGSCLDIQPGNSDAAQVVTWNVPDRVRPGQQFTVAVTMYNSGNTTWLNEIQGDVYQNRIYYAMTPAGQASQREFPIPEGTTVAPKGTYTWYVPVTAPSSPGQYQFGGWMICRNQLPVNYVGDWLTGCFTDQTPRRTLTVTGSAFASTLTGMSVNSVTLTGPNTTLAMIAGKVYPVEIRLKNSGDDPWTTDRFKLVSYDASGETYWYPDAISLPANVQPGSEVTLKFNVRAPAAPGTYNFQWRMTEEGVGWVGDPTYKTTANVKASTTCSPAPQGLVTFWTGDVNATDLVGTNNGTVSGQVAFTPGMVGPSFAFPGSEPGAVKAPTANFPDAASDKTVEFWLKKDSAGDINFLIHGDLVNYTNRFGAIRVAFVGYRLGTKDENLYLFSSGYPTRDGLVGGFNITSPTPLQLGRWYHVALTSSGGIVYLYLDGQEVGHVLKKLSYPSGSPLELGTSGGQTNVFTGQIDEVGVYNRGLTADELRNISNAGSMGKCRVANYSISGATTFGGAGLGGVKLTLSSTTAGFTPRSVTSAATTGAYSFPNVPGGRSYVLTPTSNVYSFTPTSRTYTNLAANQTLQNFAATRKTYAISGRALLGTAGVNGLVILLKNSSGTVIKSTTTATSAAGVTGSYSFAGVPAGFGYTVVPAASNLYSFTPANRTYASLISNLTGQNFSATRKLYTISGRVIKYGTTTGVDGVTMTLRNSSGVVVKTVTTATSAAGVTGSYTITGVQAGYSYTLRPTKTGMTFIPLSRSYTNLSANQTLQNFSSQ